MQKFGGTSVGSIEQILGVAKRIAAVHHEGHRIIAVVSAMGSQTDQLRDLAYKVSNRPSRRELDMLLSAGERVSMALLSMALHQHGIAATSLTGSQCGILTDSTHGNARIVKILGDRIRDSMESSQVVIVAGFQGVCPKTKDITTLGRGGSDLTAVALAASLGARCCEIFTDVDGVYTADPHKIPSARRHEELSWDQMVALAENGAAVVHDRAAQLALKHQMPLHIRSSASPHSSEGQAFTLIRGRNMFESALVTGVVKHDSLTHILWDCGRDAPAHPAHELARGLAQKGIGLHLCQQLSQNDAGQVHVLVGSEDAEEVVGMIEGWGAIPGRTIRSQQLAAAVVVGSSLLQDPNLLDRCLSSLEPDFAPKQGLLDLSHNRFLFGMTDETIDGAIAALHAALFDQGSEWREDQLAPKNSTHPTEVT